MNFIHKDLRRIRDFIASNEDRLEIFYSRNDSGYLSYFCSLLGGTFYNRINEVLFMVQHYLTFSFLKVWLYRLSGVRMGKNVYMGPHVKLDPHFPNLVEIGENVLIGMDTRISSHEISQNRLTLGRAGIGDNTVIGAYTIIKCGVRIGKNVEIAMGSVVSKDVPDGCKAIGNPARIVRPTNSDHGDGGRKAGDDAGRTLEVLLVNPRWRGFGNRKKIKASESNVHPLTLGIVAAIVKRHDPRHRVTVIDQNNQDIPYYRKFDLIGITVNTYTAGAAYTIADRFKGLGKVVFGGVHATLMQDECLEHADAVVTGEAESALPKLLDDLRAGRLDRLYSGGSVSDLSMVPIPDRHLICLPGAAAAYVQATRGCDNICKFCYLRYVPWSPYRKRPVDDVIRELREIEEKVILFVDDNMFVDRDYCIELFSRMKLLGKFWWAQAPTTLARDPELLSAAAESGCFSLSYGFQTVNERSLEGDLILQNRIRDYREITALTQKVGILVDGTFIFGFRGDGPGIFGSTVRMVMEMNLDTYTFYMLTPYPGTPYYDEYSKEGRLATRDHGKFDWDHAVIEPGGMTSLELDAGVRWAYETLDRYYRATFWKRALSNYRFLFKSLKLVGFLLSSGIPGKYHNDY